MKKVLFLLVVLFTTAMSVNAQSCQKSASAGGAACCAKKMASASTADIDAALAADKSVEKRVCAESGKVSYFQKSVDGANTTWNEVAYDANAKGFTKVAAASMERASTEEVKVSKACSAQEKAACEKAGKSCCKKGNSACTAKKPEGSK